MRRWCVGVLCTALAFTGALPAGAEEQIPAEILVCDEVNSIEEEQDLLLEMSSADDQSLAPETGPEEEQDLMPAVHIEEDTEISDLSGEKEDAEERVDLSPEMIDAEEEERSDGAGEVLLTVMVRSDNDETETEYGDKVYILNDDGGTLQRVLIETYRISGGNEDLVMISFWDREGYWGYIDPEDEEPHYLVEEGLYGLMGDDIWNIEVTDESSGMTQGAGGYRLYYEDGTGDWAYFLTAADVYAGLPQTEAASYDPELPAEFYIGVMGDHGRHAGLKQIDGAYYYLNADGTIVMNQVMNIDGYTYHFGTDGKCTSRTEFREAGWELFSDGTWHWRNADGTYIVSNGFYLLDEDWYYISKSGARKHGWLTYNKKVYYLDPDSGKGVTGLFEADDATYYHSKKNGYRLTGIISLKGGKYYFAKNGKRTAGFVISGGRKYYFSPRTFKMRYGWVDDGGFRYYAGKGGVILTGAQEIKGKLYVFDTDGKLIRNDKAYRLGDRYYCCYSGGTAVELTELQYLANSQLKNSGWTVNKSFNWITANYTESSVPAKPSPAVSDLDYYAMYGFEHKSGNAFVMAAALCVTAGQIGKEAHLVEGYITLNGNRIPSAWVEIVTDGTTYVYDPYFTFKTGNYGKMLTYGGAGTWNYSDYQRVS